MKNIYSKGSKSLWDDNRPSSSQLIIKIISGIALALMFLATANVNVRGQSVDRFTPNADRTVLTFAEQTDGKVLIGGMFLRIDGKPHSYLARLNADGTPDPTFNLNTDNFVSAMVKQADGKILIGGRFSSVGGQSRHRIARLNADGTLDTTFNPNAHSGTFDVVLSLALQPDGRILAGGDFRRSDISEFENYRGIERFNQNGTIDGSFNVITNGSVSAVTAQGDGRVFIGGGFTYVNGRERKNVARLAGNGVLDTSFNTNINGSIESIIVQRDGRVLIGGKMISRSGEQNPLNVARLLTDGAFDASFSTNINGAVYTIAEQADGRILVGGKNLYGGSGGQGYINFARLQANGNPDASFEGNTDGPVENIGMQADGRILIGGNFSFVKGQPHTYFARLNETQAGSPNSPAYPTTANFVGVESTNQGNWLGKYAAQGVSLVGDATSFPNWLQFSVSGHNTHVWANSTTDTRALNKASNNSDRIAATLYTSGTYNNGQFDLKFNFTDGQPHRLALYALDWDNQNRRQTFELINTSTNTVIDTRTISNFSNGVYVVWNVQGQFTVRVKNNGETSLNAVLSGIFIDPPSSAIPSPAYPTTTAFLGFESTNQGSWLGKYASQGIFIPGDATSFPGWLQFSVTNQNTHVWANSTTDIRALNKASNNSDRIASTLYTSGTYNNGQFELNFNFTDGQIHRLALYALDWDSQGRQQTFELVNTMTGAVLDTRTISNFSTGVYVNWNVQGQVSVRVRNVGANSLNAVLSGVFIDPPSTAIPAPSYPPSAAFVRFDNVNQGNWLGKYASQGISMIGDGTNFPGWLQFSVTGQSSHIWANSTADQRALIKTGNHNDRIAATLYTPNAYAADQFELNFNFTDGQAHRLAIYSLDWDNQNRQQVFELINTSTGVVLDTRTISNFGNGVYVVWNVQGQFTVRVKNSGGSSLNAVVSGIFIDNP